MSQSIYNMLVHVHCQVYNSMGNSEEACLALKLCRVSCCTLLIREVCLAFNVVTHLVLQGESQGRRGKKIPFRRECMRIHHQGGVLLAQGPEACSVPFLAFQSFVSVSVYFACISHGKNKHLLHLPSGSIQLQTKNVHKHYFRLFFTPPRIYPTLPLPCIVLYIWDPACWAALVAQWVRALCLDCRVSWVRIPPRAALNFSLKKRVVLGVVELFCLCLWCLHV